MSQILSVIWLGELPRRGRIIVEQENQPSADMSVVQRQSWIQWRFVSAAGAAQPSPELAQGSSEWESGQGRQTTGSMDTLHPWISLCPK